MMRPDLSQERALWEKGFSLVAGLDEAGRGPWAGPVVAAAVVLPPDDPQLGLKLQGVQDSKRLTPLQRERLYPIILATARAVGIGVVSPERIDAVGIVKATREAMAQAIAELSPPPHFLLIDYLHLPEVPIPQKSIPHGDASCLSVAAASIVAKVYRDRLMRELAALYPGYGFARNKGYGTPEHRRALASLGPCPLHRRSFRPVRQALENLPDSARRLD